MISRLLFLFLLVWVGDALAGTYPPSREEWKVSSLSTWSTSAGAACDARDSSTFDYVAVQYSTYVQYRCQMIMRSNGSIYDYATLDYRAYCGDGTLVNFNAGGVNINNRNTYCSVEPPPDCTDTTPMTVKQDYGTSLSSAVGKFPDHYGKCVVKVEKVLHCDQYTATGVYSCTYQASRTGEVYTGSSSSTAATDPAPSGTQSKPSTLPPTSASSGDGSCPAGSVQGGRDPSGIPICIGTGTSSSPSKSNTTTTSPTVTKTNDDGSSTSTTTVSTKNSDGSVTTTVKTTTTGADGTVSTKVDTNTSLTPGGTTGKADSGPGTAAAAAGDEKSSFCAENPTLSVCRESSVTGSCSNGVSTLACTGDAIQCATLQKAAAIQCAQENADKQLKDSPLYSLGLAAANGNDPDKAGLPSSGNGTTVAVPTSLDTSGWLGAGAPFDDVSFTVQGKSITVPLNKWSSYLIALRYVLMVVATLVSFRMLSGAIIRE